MYPYVIVFRHILTRRLYNEYRRYQFLHQETCNNFTGQHNPCQPQSPKNGGQNHRHVAQTYRLRMRTDIGRVNVTVGLLRSYLKPEGYQAESQYIVDTEIEGKRVINNVLLNFPNVKG